MVKNDLISRSPLKEHISSFAGMWTDEGFMVNMTAVLGGIDFAPTVDAVVLSKGRPGDYLEWETGIVGHTTIQPIKAILICEDCVRYDLGVFAPIVDHENIVRIMSREEAKREIERRGDGA